MLDLLPADALHTRGQLLAVQEAGDLLHGLEVALDVRGERLAARR